MLVSAVILGDSGQEVEWEVEMITMEAKEYDSLFLIYRYICFFCLITEKQLHMNAIE